MNELFVCIRPVQYLSPGASIRIHQHPEKTQHTRKATGPTFEITGYSSTRNKRTW